MGGGDFRILTDQTTQIGSSVLKKKCYGNELTHHSSTDYRLGPRMTTLQWSNIEYPRLYRIVHARQSDTQAMRTYNGLHNAVRYMMHRSNIPRH
jgi:hypothetical protein